jgi:hypothetical protein
MLAMAMLFTLPGNLGPPLFFPLPGDVAHANNDKFIVNRLFVQQASLLPTFPCTVDVMQDTLVMAMAMLFTSPGHLGPPLFFHCLETSHMLFVQWASLLPTFPCTMDVTHANNDKYVITRLFARRHSSPLSCFLPIYGLVLT